MQLLTVAQVATQLQIHPETVRDYLRQGLLKGKKIGNGPKASWRVTPEAIAEFLKG